MPLERQGRSFGCRPVVSKAAALHRLASRPHRRNEHLIVAVAVPVWEYRGLHAGCCGGGRHPCPRRPRIRCGTPRLPQCTDRSAPYAVGRAIRPRPMSHHRRVTGVGLPTAGFWPVTGRDSLANHGHPPRPVVRHRSLDPGHHASTRPGISPEVTRRSATPRGTSWIASPSSRNRDVLIVRLRGSPVKITSTRPIPPPPRRTRGQETRKSIKIACRKLDIFA